MTMSRPALRSRPIPRGAATLVVVMVLFFIVALVAAYTSRNLIFEQRTSANQYRSTQAFEAAEAGLEWTLTMLNSGRIDAACVPRTDPDTADESFRQRYLNIATDTGQISARLRAGGALPRQAACVFDGTGWQCSCPTDDAPTLAAPVGPGPFPAFVLRFHDRTPDGAPYPAGVVRVESTGCTRLDAAEVCSATTSSGDGRATVNIVAALKSALTNPPGAALTVRGDLAGANTLQAVNTDVAAGGITLRVGGTITGEPQALLGPAGTPSDTSDLAHNVTVVSPDTGLAALSPDRLLSSLFAAERGTYRLQPAAVQIRCAVDCAASTVRDMARLNPGRVLWVDGDVDINIPDTIGSTDFPVVLVVNGSLSVSNAAAKVNGLVYIVGDTLTNIGNLALAGALVAEGNLTLGGGGVGVTAVTYDRARLDLLHRTNGSFVRIPGSWRDF